MPFSRNTNGVELRYNRGELTVTDLSTIPEITNDEEWDAAPTLGVTTVTPLDDSIDASGVFPNEGIFKLYGRLLNNVGNQGPIFYAGVFIVGEVPQTSNFNASPAWAGTLQNMAVWPHTLIRRLYANPSNHKAVTLNDWNGGGAFPFGAYDGTSVDAPESDRTQYTTREIDFGRLRLAEVFVEYTGEIPTSFVDQTAETFPLTLIHSLEPITANPAVATTIPVSNGIAETITARYIRARLRVTSSTRTAVRSLQINWRYLDS